MSNSIKISPKHGVNPTIPICFWCGEEKGEIALMGKLKDDMEAPRNMVLDYEPCDKCKERFALGVTLIGTTTHCPDNRPPIQDNEDGTLYPTGAWIVITKDAAQRYFAGVATPEEIDNTERILVEQEFIDYLNDQMRQMDETEQ